MTMRDAAWDELEDLRAKLDRGEGSADQAEAWLRRLKELARELAPGLHDSDIMWDLEHGVKVRRKAQQLRDQMGGPLTREQLAALVRSIRDAEAEGMDVVELDARFLLFKQSVPHPRPSEVLYRLYEGATPEQVAAAAFERRATFELPGP